MVKPELIVQSIREIPTGDAPELALEVKKAFRAVDEGHLSGTSVDLFSSGNRARTHYSPDTVANTQRLLEVTDRSLSFTRVDILGGVHTEVFATRSPQINWVVTKSGEQLGKITLEMVPPNSNIVQSGFIREQAGLLVQRFGNPSEKMVQGTKGEILPFIAYKRDTSVTRFGIGYLIPESKTVKFYGEGPAAKVVQSFTALELFRSSTTVESDTLFWCWKSAQIPEDLGELSYPPVRLAVYFREDGFGTYYDMAKNGDYTERAVGLIRSLTYQEFPISLEEIEREIIRGRLKETDGLLEVIRPLRKRLAEQKPVPDSEVGIDFLPKSTSNGVAHENGRLHLFPRLSKVVRALFSPVETSDELIP